MYDNRPAILVDLPTSIRGFVFHDDDGEPMIVLNARLSHEQNRMTYEHEKEHIRHDDMYNTDYIEYGV
jgi:hypothetical protein